MSNNWERFNEMQQKLTTHKYVEIDVMDSQICQKCHKVLSFKKTYKCTLCDYTCHQHCAADKVSDSLERFIVLSGRHSLLKLLRQLHT